MASRAMSSCTRACQKLPSGEGVKAGGAALEEAAGALEGLSRAEVSRTGMAMRLAAEGV